MSTFITRLAAAPDKLATANNSVAGDSPSSSRSASRRSSPAIPATVSPSPPGRPCRAWDHGDPRRHRHGRGRRPELTRRLDRHRAAGVPRRRHHGGLSPQADLATEPRWTRINGTFGSDPRAVKRHVEAYVDGLAGRTRRATRRAASRRSSKHWAGYGAQANGYDSHYYYGRYATFPGGNFAAHLVPYDGRVRGRDGGHHADVLDPQGPRLPGTAGAGRRRLQHLPAPGPAARPVRLPRRDRLGLRASPETARRSAGRTARPRRSSVPGASGCRGASRT